MKASPKAAPKAMKAAMKAMKAPKAAPQAMKAMKVMKAAPKAPCKKLLALKASLEGRQHLLRLAKIGSWTGFPQSADSAAKVAKILGCNNWRKRGAVQQRCNDAAVTQRNKGCKSGCKSLDEDPWMQICIEPHMSMSSKLCVGEQISTHCMKATDTIRCLKWKILNHYPILPLDFDFVLLYKGQELDIGRYPNSRYLLQYGIADGDVIHMLWGPEGDAAISKFWGESEEENELCDPDTSSSYEMRKDQKALQARANTTKGMNKKSTGCR